MLPPDRDPERYYRVSLDTTHITKNFYEVKYYAETQPVQEVRGFYCWETLPEWLKNCMAALDAAGAGHTVPGVGHKLEGAYWIGPTNT
jgi:hypothetical protein